MWANNSCSEISKYENTLGKTWKDRILSRYLMTIQMFQMFQMFKLDLERQRNQRANCQHQLDYGKSKRVPEKHQLLFYWLYQSLWLCGSQQTGKFLKRWEYQITLPVSWEICMQVKNKQNWTWNIDWFQIGKGVHQDCILSLCLFNLYA